MLLSKIFAALLLGQNAFPSVPPVGEFPQIDKCSTGACEISADQLLVTEDAVNRFRSTFKGVVSSIVIHGSNPIEVTLFFHDGPDEGARTYTYSSDRKLLNEHLNR
jgi:hypothetical protein